MIISRTPFRISLAGGGTDLKSFYENEQGKVLSTTINKYIYVVVKRQIGVIEHKYRINWSQVEFRNNINDIEHPIVRECLKAMKIDFPIEITTFADIPASTGLGSSSAFAVGLIHALYALKGKLTTKYTLAKEAAKIEVDILGRVMGKQDHFASSYGNLNVITFNENESVNVEPVFYDPIIRKKLDKNLLLFYTNITRDASEVLKAQDKGKIVNKVHLQKMKGFVEPLREIISSGERLHEIGEILHEGWKLKRNLSNLITSPEIDNNYKKARDAGAIGGKLLGAGGGGFLLFYVDEKNQKRVMKELSDLYFLPMKFDNSGTRITYYDQPNV